MSGEGAAAGAAGADAAAAAATAAAAAAANKPWYDGADAETVGYLQNRGWDKIDAKAAAQAAVKAHREAEKHLGAPPDQLVRLPKDANDKEGWAKVYDKLGVPSDPKAYDFANVKFGDGTALDDAVIENLRKVAGEAKLTKAGAETVAKAVVGLIESAETSENADYALKLAQEKDTLQKNWGMNAAVNKVVAENAAQRLGVSKAEIDALEKVVGYARVMELFRNVGSRIGEDKFVSGGTAGGAMTKEQAIATMKQRENDSAWIAKLNNGDSAIIQEFHNLTQIMAAR